MVVDYRKPCPMPPSTWWRPSPYQLFRGDCLDWFPLIPNRSINTVLSDPPYPWILREYGILTAGELLEMMQRVVQEVLRVLTPDGSAVFVLQPTSVAVGTMSPWLWDFMGWLCRNTNVIQDAYWWNHTMIPEHHSIHGRLLRPSVKYCVWIGSPDCYRDQEQVLWEESDANKAQRWSNRRGWSRGPSGHRVNQRACVDVALRRGGVTPFNLLPCPSVERGSGHPAATPVRLADWWLRYICPTGGTVLDPFSGSASVGVAAIRQGKKYIGIEQRQDYHERAGLRLQALLRENRQRA